MGGFEGDVSLSEVLHGSVEVVDCPVAVHSSENVVDEGHNVSVDDVVVQFGKKGTRNIKIPAWFPDENFGFKGVVFFELEEGLEFLARLQSMFFCVLLRINDLNESLPGEGGLLIEEVIGVGKGFAHPGRSPQAHLKHGCFLLKVLPIFLSGGGFKELDQGVGVGIIQKAAEGHSEHSDAPQESAALDVPSCFQLDLPGEVLGGSAASRRGRGGLTLPWAGEVGPLTGASFWAGLFLGACFGAMLQICECIGGCRNCRIGS